MEQLLHYCWKHKLFPLEPLTTTDGQSVEVIDTGLHNHNAGPDFFNAKVNIGGTLWVGNVEIHDKSTDWYLHGHDHDPHYNNVVLHITGNADTEVRTANGDMVPQLVMRVPEAVERHYEELLREDRYPPCYRIIPRLPRLAQHSWMSALQTERLEQKTEQIRQRVALCDGSWEQAYFATLARSFGFGVNSEAFEQWALAVPLNVVAHHRDNLFQVEALFMGQAGLLDPESLNSRHREQARTDGYFDRLAGEYKFLAHKYGLHPIDFHRWRFMRLRPQNFPTIRLSQLAMLYYKGQAGLSQAAECATPRQVEALVATQTTPYWETHYTFGAPAAKCEKHLSRQSVEVIAINAIVPALFAYGRHKEDERLCDRAFDLLEQLKAEDNHIVRMWRECGLNAENAGDTQALLQLKNGYCDRRDCLRCRFGYEYLKANP